ncbi:hypothetical protein [Miltoncostaea oceani]|uniref:hypothetical protein n=1 Tax=Miltoncostaea oceani TaxID=2843216 RepID=UPI001C3C516A|nr:hypothetical protein [Miltoncostaea oceani]
MSSCDAEDTAAGFDLTADPPLDRDAWVRQTVAQCRAAEVPEGAGRFEAEVLSEAGTRAVVRLAVSWPGGAGRSGQAQMVLQDGTWKVAQGI